jgi:hypothetical protein
VASCNPECLFGQLSEQNTNNLILILPDKARYTELICPESLDRIEPRTLPGRVEPEK